MRARGVRWGMSLDMVGEDTEKTGGTFLIEKMPDPSAVWTRGDDHHTEWGGEPLTARRPRAALLQRLRARTRCRDQAAVTGWVVRTNPFEGGSDHTPFLRAGKPGLLLWHFTDVYYHTDGDRLGKVSPRRDGERGRGGARVGAAHSPRPTVRRRARLVADVERAAVARLETEGRLSRAAIAAGKPAADERLILRTWADYYVQALRATADIQVGGSDAATRAAIEAAVSVVQKAGAQELATLG